MDYKDKLRLAKEALDSGSYDKETIEYIFPELKEGEDERIRKKLIEVLSLNIKGAESQMQNCSGVDRTFEIEACKKGIAWLEKQGEQNHADNVEPKFKVGDWVIDKQDIVHQIANVMENVTYHTYGYDIVGGGYFNDNTEGIRLWTIQDVKDGDVLYTSSTASHETFIFKNIDEKGNAECYFAYDSEDGFREGKYHFIGRAINCKPATKEQRDLLFQKMKEAGYEWDADKLQLKKIKQKPTEEEMKELLQTEYEKGRADAIAEMQKSWSEEDEPLKELAETYLAVFDKHFPILPTLKGKQLADYKNFLNQCQQILGLKYWGIHPTQARLFEKLSLLWAAWGAEHLKGLGQTDGDTDNEKQKWGEEDEESILEIYNYLDRLVREDEDNQATRLTVQELKDWLKSLKDRVLIQPEQEWSEEDNKRISRIYDFLLKRKRGFSAIIWQIEEDANWLKSLRPQNNATDEELAKAKKNAYNDALNKIEYHSGEPTFDDGWSAAIWYLKKRNAQPQNTWKPSEKQIEALKGLLGLINQKSMHGRELVSLIEQLKKLREE